MASFRADPIITETLTPVSGSSGKIVVAGKTVDVTTAGAAVALQSGASAAVTGSDPGMGVFWVSSSSPTTAYFRQSDGTDIHLSEVVAAPLARPFQKHMDWPEGTDQGGNEIQYSMWYPVSASIVSVQALMAVTNSNGAYALSIRNNNNSVLGVTSYNMNGLTPGIITDIILTASSDFKSLDPFAEMTIALSSSAAGFNGSGTFLSIFAEEVTA